jgi:hypothetical protein
LSRETNFALYVATKSALHAIVAELQLQAHPSITGEPADPAVVTSAQGVLRALRPLIAILPASEELESLRLRMVDALNADEAVILASFRGDHEAVIALLPAMKAAGERLDQEQGRLHRVLGVALPPRVVSSA